MRLSRRITIIVLLLIVLGLFIAPGIYNRTVSGLNYLITGGDETSKPPIPDFPFERPFHLGLDLLGGVHLVYEADLSTVGDQDPTDAMSGVRDVIERRVNLFGVAEPIVQQEGDNRLIVELAGVVDVREAIAIIGQTPFLEFKEQRPEEETLEIITAQENGERLNEDPFFISTGLTGQHLKKSTLTFDQFTTEAQVSLELNDEGVELFADITKRNIGQIVAIYLDGIIISAPVVNDEILTGNAIISGNFTPEEARELVTRLNAGALPMAIELISQQSVGATLGEISLQKSLTAGIYGLIAVAIFMVFFYRLPGILAVAALAIYVIIVLAVYKLVPVTLTLAGVAGFVLSLGMAVDANILIFARMREELKGERKLTQAMHNGFSRAWFSIRDGHITTLIGAIVLFGFSTSIVKGFALTLGIGVLVSLFTSIFVTRAFLELFTGPKFEKKRWLF